MKALYQRADFPSYRMNRTSHGSKTIYSAKPQWVEALGFVLGACLDAFDLELHAGCFNYNHEHLSAGHPLHDEATVAPRYSDFIQRFHFLWWMILVANKEWEGLVYSRLERTHQGPVLDAEEFWRAATYDTAQAVKAGLFERTKFDPSLVFLPQDVLKPRRFARNALIDAVDPDKTIFPFEEVTVQLGVPRIFSHLSRRDYAKAFATKLKDYEDEVRAPRVHLPAQTIRRCRRIQIGQPIGADTHKTRGKKHRRKSPGAFRPAYSSIPELEAAYRKEESTFLTDHKASYRDMKKHGQVVKFPAGTYGWRRLMNVQVRPPPSTCWAGQPLWYPD